MLGLPQDVMRAQLVVVGRWLRSPDQWPEVRRRYELVAKLPPPPRGTTVTSTRLGGVPGLDVRPPGTDPGTVLLYLHGGGYCIGSSTTHKALAARIAAAAGSRAVVLDYRMGDEHPYPAALDDAKRAYGALLDEGIPPSRILVAGDSAGGGLTVALALVLRDDSAPLPAALGLICPWVDLTRETNAARPDAPREPLLSKALLQRFADDYLQGHDASDPLASPVFGDLAGLPPMVVHWGSIDLIAPDGRAIAEKARAAGIEVEERGFDGLWHDFHASAPLLSGPGREALGAMGDALARHLT